MAFSFPDGLAPEAYPLAWLVGQWRGEGVIDYPSIPKTRFVQDVTFDHDGGPYLRYESTIRILEAAVPDNAAALAETVSPDSGGSPDEGGVDARSAASADADADTEADVAPDAADVVEEPLTETVWSTETGYWRIPPERPEEVPEDRTPLEVLIVDPAGHATIYVGAMGNGRVDLASDLIARTATGAEVTGSTRMYGLVEGTLMWVWEMAAFGQPLQNYASAQLFRKEN